MSQWLTWSLIAHQKQDSKVFKAMPHLRKCFSAVRGSASGANMKVILVRSSPGRAPGQLAAGLVKPCSRQRRSAWLKLFPILPPAVKTEQSRLLLSSLGCSCERGIRVSSAHWAETAGGPYNVTEIHSLIGRRLQRRWLKETEREGSKGSREKTEEGVGSGKGNRDFLRRREQKQGAL